MKSKNIVLASGHKITKEEVERAILEKRESEHLEGQKNHGLNGSLMEEQPHLKELEETI